MKRLLLAVMLCVGMLSVWAVPAKRLSLTVKQPDGTQLTIVQHGDEHFHYFTTEDGVLLKKSAQGFFYAQSTVENRLVATENLAHNAAERSVEEQAFVMSLPQLSEVISDSRARSMNRRSTVQQKTATPVTGDVKVPVILVQYKDKKFAPSDPVAEYVELLNSEEPFTGRRGYASARKYFMDQSEGKFIPTFDVLGPVTLSKNMEYYGGNDKDGNDLHPTEMIEEACRLVNSSADFKEYDNNGDGYVDFVYVIYAGYGEASNTNELENTIWPHAWALPTPLSADGVKVQRYACSNELNGYQGSTLAGIGTLCHEFSHCLGLPDFYDIDYSGGFGLSSWSIMNSGNYNDDGYTPCGYTGYEKDYIGWKSLVVLEEPQEVKLYPVSEGGNSYKIVNDANENEYYVVENHKKSNWDKGIPAEGMLVFHVDYLRSAWENNAPNDDPHHQRMTIIPADNKLNDATLRGDTYPGSTGNTALTTTSTPAAKVYKGEFMYKDITNIAMNGNVVTFSFMKGALPVPQMQELADITESGFTASWKEAAGINEYEIYLEKLEKSPYMLEEDFRKMKAGSADIASSLDSYTVQEGWTGANVFGLDGAIRLGTTSQLGGVMSPTFKCDSLCYTVFVTMRKSSAADKDAGVLIAVGDDAWEYLLGGIGTIDNEDWTTYRLLVDTIGANTYLYIDTRDNPNTPKTEGLRVDVDDIYILPGDWTGTDEDTTSTSAAAPRRAKRNIEASRIARPMNHIATKVAQMQKSQSVTETYIDFIDEQRYYVTPVHTARTTELSYRFEGLDGGHYRTAVRSMQGETYSRYSPFREVEIVDGMLPQAAMPAIYVHNDSVFIEVADSAAVLYYTLDGSIPTAYSARYTTPFFLDRKALINAIARKEGHRSSDVQEFDNWFEQEGATYRIESTIAPKAHLSDAMGGNDEKSYAGHFVVPGEVIYDSVTYVVSGIDPYAFRNAVSLRSVTVGGEALHSVGDGLFLGCKNLSAVVWDVDLPLAASAFDASGYNNLLVYLPETMDFEHPLIEKQNMTLVKGDACATLVLNAQFPFYAPRTFNAGQVSFTRFFSQQTALGSSAGWETIALPFDVQHIEHSSKGVIAPFGVEADKHFWLAEPDGDGFSLAEGIRANTAYIIAMPNHKDYGDNALSGQVTFSADNAVVYATDALCAAEGCEYRLMPTYDKLEADEDIYALNIGVKHDGLAPGSVFAPGKYAVNPFSAYLAPAENGQKAPMYRIQINKEIEDAPMEFSVMAKGGVVIVTLPEARDIEVYDIAGRSVCTIEGKAGANEITHLQTGFYLIEKTKVYVKH
jgi:M6 family metalloprotease-like protein